MDLYNENVNTPLLGGLRDRMLGYEQKDNLFLNKKTPVIVRVDGSNFSKFTKHFEGKFNNDFNQIMVNTAEKVAKELSGCQMVTTHSDEISFFLCDFISEKTEPLFNYSKRKLESKIAGKVTREFILNLIEFNYSHLLQDFDCFDARAFNLPKDDVLNYFIYRQLDGVRNSIQMIGRLHFKQKDMLGVSNIKLTEKLDSIGVSIDSIPLWAKYGNIFFKLPVENKQKFNGSPISQNLLDIRHIISNNVIGFIDN